MGLAMRCEKGRIYPVLTCDTCGKPIEDWKVVIAACSIPAEYSIVDVSIFHKGYCDPTSSLYKQEKAEVLKEVDHYLRKKEYKLTTALDQYLPWLLWHQKWGKISSTKHGDRLTIDVPQPMSL